MTKLTPAQERAMAKLGERGYLSTGMARWSTVSALAKLGLITLTSETHMHVNAYSGRREWVREWHATSTNNEGN